MFFCFSRSEPVLLVLFIEQVRNIVPADFNLFKLILLPCNVFLLQYKCALYYIVILKMHI